MKQTDRQWSKINAAIRGLSADTAPPNDQAWDGIISALSELLNLAGTLRGGGGRDEAVGGNPTQTVPPDENDYSVPGAAAGPKPITREAFDTTVFHGTRRTALESILDNGLQAHPSRHYHPERFYEGERGDSVYVATDPIEAARWALSEVANAADATVLEIEVPEESLVPDEEWSGAERHVGDIPPPAIIKIYPVNADGTLGECTNVNRRPINEGRVRWIGLTHGDPPDEEAPDWPAAKNDARLVYPPQDSADDDDDLSGRFELLPGGLQLMDKQTGQVFLVDDLIRKLTANDGRPLRDRTKTPAMDGAALSTYVGQQLDPALPPDDDLGPYVQRRLATRELPAMDKMPLGWSGTVQLREQDAPAGMAFDRMSARSYSEDGHLHVARSRIAQARIDGYAGQEIPGWRQLGLDANKIYQLLRDPRELSQPETVASFCGKPILEDHEPISADSHKRELVVGSIGSDVRWTPPFLEASLHFWPREAIDTIESGEKKQLSPSYHYEVSMEPGIWNGQRYDGMMKNIRAQHLALVHEGRQGPNVVVADEAPLDPRWLAIERAITALR